MLGHGLAERPPLNMAIVRTPLFDETPFLDTHGGTVQDACLDARPVFAKTTTRADLALAQMMRSSSRPKFGKSCRFVV
jgi:hypothetical protein